MRLVDFKYVYCPVLKEEIRIKHAYERISENQNGKKVLIDCVGAFKCGAGKVKNGKVVHDFTRCPFSSIQFID